MNYLLDNLFNLRFYHMTEKIPDIIIIVPYRDRENHRAKFIKHMPKILNHLNYKILFIHQYDQRLFNRGAIKNIGFIYVKNQYPNHYKNITLVFNDIDTMPRRKNQFSYNTPSNYVNHFYGYRQALGGIFAIKGGDFERVNGFPNIWTWGLEDNSIKLRCDKLNIQINRNEFIHYTESNKIIELAHGPMRIISPNIETKLYTDFKFDGITTLYNINYRATSIAMNIEEVLVDYFETPEPFTSPFVKFASFHKVDKFPRLDKIIKVKNNKVKILSRKRNINRLLYL